LGQNWLNFELTFPPIEQAITSLKPGIRLTKANLTVRFQFGLGLRERDLPERELIQLAVTQREIERVLTENDIHWWERERDSGGRRDKLGFC
jgi:hypothetical protein